MGKFWKFGGLERCGNWKFWKFGPQNAGFPVEWKFDPKPAEIWTRAKLQPKNQWGECKGGVWVLSSLEPPQTPRQPRASELSCVCQHGRKSGVAKSKAAGGGRYNMVHQPWPEPASCLACNGRDYLTRTFTCPNGVSPLYRTDGYRARRATPTQPLRSPGRDCTHARLHVSQRRQRNVT